MCLIYTEGTYRLAVRMHYHIYHSRTGIPSLHYSKGWVIVAFFTDAVHREIAAPRSTGFRKWH